MLKRLYFLFILLLPYALHAQDSAPYILILGTAQDGGYPHIGCDKKCCRQAWKDNRLKRYVVSLALVEPGTKKWWLFEATPDIKEQLHYFHTLTKNRYSYLPQGIFVTHAHIGHYTGLMELGREAMNTKDVLVYALPKLKEFLETNGPWSQLVKLQNIKLAELTADIPMPLSEKISVAAFVVPHRDEYSETAGFKINAGKTKYLFIPDINKWDKWTRNITDEVNTADIALLDGTFYDDTELPGRNMSEIPHPFVVETMGLFKNSGKKTTSKIHFIHFNHTNPLLWNKQVQDNVKNKGFNIAEQGSRL
jgi:pyrroloquinoline quinone biosynthesis protein B